eukprot:SAG31_NODE_31287_length_370_cov_0.538745_1_plen_60_part_10
MPTAVPHSAARRSEVRNATIPGLPAATAPRASAAVTTKSTVGGCSHRAGLLCIFEHLVKS